MIKKLLTLNLLLALVFQPVTVVFAGGGGLDDEFTTTHFSSSMMDCEHMNTLDCPGTEVCSNVGHTGCDLKNLRFLSIVESGAFNLSISMLPHRGFLFPLTESAPPLRPPKNS
jgi:hypothetical protein